MKKKTDLGMCFSNRKDVDFFSHITSSHQALRMNIFFFREVFSTQKILIRAYVGFTKVLVQVLSSFTGVLSQKNSLTVQCS